MYLSYFMSEQFPYPQGPADGPYANFPGTPRGLGAYRPNQALERVYSTRAALNGRGLYHLRGLGDDGTTSIAGVDVNLPLLVGGGVLLAFALGMFGKKKYRGYQKRRTKRRRQRIQRKIGLLQAQM